MISAVDTGRMESAVSPRLRLVQRGARGREAVHLARRPPGSLGMG